MHYESVEDFCNSLTLSLAREGTGRIGSLLWAEGLLFRHVPYISTDSISKEYLKGHLPLDNIDFTRMAEFKEEIYYKQYTITVLNVTNNFVLSRIAKWVLENILDNRIVTRKKIKRT